MKRETTIKWYNHAFRVLALTAAAVLMWAGIMSLIDADIVVKYVFATVVVFFIAKELY